jgi:hypothetical protein
VKRLLLGKSMPENHDILLETRIVILVPVGQKVVRYSIIGREYAALPVTQNTVNAKGNVTSGEE